MDELEKNNIVVVESTYREPIEIAHIKAKEIFTHVSNIDSSANGSIHFFIIAPDIGGPIPEQILLESKFQQTFVEWCNAENKKAQTEILKIDIIKY